MVSTPSSGCTSPNTAVLRGACWEVKHWGRAGGEQRTMARSPGWSTGNHSGRNCFFLEIYLKQHFPTETVWLVSYSWTACLPVLYVKLLAVFLPVPQDCRAEGIDRKGDIELLEFKKQSCQISPLRTYLRGRPGAWWPGPWEDLSLSSSLSAAPAALSPSSGELSFSAAGERPVQWLLLTLLSPWPEQWQGWHHFRHRHSKYWFNLMWL